MVVRRAASPMIATGALVLALGVGSIASADQNVRVEMADFSFNPSQITVPAGETINFTLVNVGQRPHDLHIEGSGFTGEAVAGSGNVAAGQSTTWAVTLDTPGTYDFWCTVGNHRAQGMVGKLQVTAAGGAAAAAPSTATPATTSLPRSGDAFGGIAAGFGALLVAAGAVLRRFGRNS